MTKYYLPLGKINEKESGDSCGKAVWNDNSQQWVYYIKYIDGGFLDPFSREVALVRNYQWARVKEEVFQHYINFLFSGNRSNLSYAERAM